MTDLAHAGVPRVKSIVFAMLVCDVLIVLGVFIYKISSHYPQLQYAQLLATYQFGIVRRALIGQLWSLFHSHVAAADVFLLGAIIILVTFAVFIFVFASIFRFCHETMPLFAYLVGSPFFFKNFVFSIGYFDVLGCLSALVALVLPLNGLFLPLVGAACVFLLFVHHLHFLLYIPAIGVIVLLRYRAARLWAPSVVVRIGALALVVGMVFVLLAFFIRPPVAPDVFFQALRDRALDPISPGVTLLWYSTIAEEIRATISTLPMNLARVPIYAALILLHAPLISYFFRMVRLLEERVDFLLVILGLIAITGGYIAICVVVFDYSRWVSNWAVCMMLVMFAVRLLPSRKRIATPIALTRSNTTLAAIVTLIPRVGITKPF